jgi:hypothetical protein
MESLGSVPGLFMSEAETRRNPFIFLLIGISSLESNLCRRKVTSLWFKRLYEAQKMGGEGANK